ncbi:transporter, partial [uncultured Desulfobulbus sp.]|uniref:transporter n=1 Tax=uncultured Desulfobulbus sp. TaxID=239745 RepID=UPI00260A7CF4
MNNGKMKKILACGLFLSALAGTQALAADQPAGGEKMKGASGTPVNSAISGGSIVPKGMFLNALNFSYRDKDSIEDDNGMGARTMEQSIYILKLRFSPWERVEIAFVPGYVHNELDSFGPMGSATVDGPTDFALGATYMFWTERAGNPFDAAITLGTNMPTGQNGVDHPAGNDVWSFGSKVGITKRWHPNHRIDWDAGINQPTETGNQGVRKDTVLITTGSYHYVFNPNFDIGVEFTLENSEDWERNGADMKNGYTEMYVGPTANYV